MAAPQDEIAGVIDAYRAAVLVKDVDAFVALYDPAVRIFDLWAVWSYDGTTALRAMVADWLGSLGDARVEVDFDEVRTIADGDLAVLHAFVRYRQVGPDGATKHQMSNRFTWTLRRVGAAWSIIHEHTSAPIAFETLKAALQR